MTDHHNALPIGHMLGEYRIDDVLGSSGFGITYCAWDTRLEKRVAIKEYLPDEFALRAAETTVRLKSSADQDAYQWGLAWFLDEVRTLAGIDHPHLNKVHRFFEANNTAYMVLEYIEGETLAALLRRDQRLDATRLRRLLNELLAGLEEVHTAGFVHCDVRPSNIMFRKDGGAVLLDFGAARWAVGQRSKRITSILTPGYTPIEQYDQKVEEIGPWSDLYSLGMVAYRCISGISESAMLDAVTRVGMAHIEDKHKDLTPAVEIGKGRYSESLLRAVDWAIEAYKRRRPQSVAAIRRVLTSGDKPGAAKPSIGAAAHPPKSSMPPKKQPGKHRRAILILVMAAVAVLFAAARKSGREVAELIFRKADDSASASVSWEGWTEFFLSTNAPKVTKFLNFDEANINVKEKDGLTPLYIAARENDRGVVKLLITSGANVNARGWDGATPLHGAVLGNAREVAELLITSGADVNAKDVFDNTPLHIAARNGAREVAELLIASGADVDAKDMFDNTPRDIVKLHGHPQAESVH